MLKKLLMFLCLWMSSFAMAQQPIKIGIIIDDLGYNLQHGRELIDLPYQLTYAILPKRPFSVALANFAAGVDKEVMVHLPMQPMQAVELGAGALTLDLTSEQFKHTVRDSIASVPHAKGVNNHMGSLLTRHPGHMAWLMDVLSESNQKLYFVDSRTTKATVAAKVAKEYYIPHIDRDIFIDNIPRKGQIAGQLQRLTTLAKEKGYAIAIGHPYPATIQALKEYLPTLSGQNILIVPITELLVQSFANSPVNNDRFARFAISD